MIKFIENTRDSLALAKLHSHESINRMNPLSMTVKICVISDVLVYENWPLKTPKGYSLSNVLLKIGQSNSYPRVL
jgi:hypothetical protein